MLNYVRVERLHFVGRYHLSLQCLRWRGRAGAPGPLATSVGPFQHHPAGLIAADTSSGFDAAKPDNDSHPSCDVQKSNPPPSLRLRKTAAARSRQGPCPLPTRRPSRHPRPSWFLVAVPPCPHRSPRAAVGRGESAFRPTFSLGRHSGRAGQRVRGGRGAAWQAARETAPRAAHGPAGRRGPQASAPPRRRRGLRRRRRRRWRWRGT